MSGQRPKIQRELAFPPEDPGEAPRTGGEGPEPPTANRAPQHPVPDIPLMEHICERENLIRAWDRVRSNGGAAGVDGLSIEKTGAGKLRLFPARGRRRSCGISAVPPVPPGVGSRSRSN